MSSSTIQDCLLVSLKTAIDKRGAQSDDAEHKAAIETRSAARSLITSVCINSDLGLLCASENELKLHEAVHDARDLAQTFNLSAASTQITVNILIGRISCDDEEAIRAINGEVHGLLDEMLRGVLASNVETIREPANKATRLLPVLSSEAAQTVEASVKAARSVARRVVKTDGSEPVPVDQLALGAIDVARALFAEPEVFEEVPEPYEPVYTGGGLFGDADFGEGEPR